MLTVKQCPICAVRLKPTRVRSFEIDACNLCGGLWLDAGELNGLSGRPMESRLKIGTIPTECRYCKAAILSGASCVRCNRPSIANCANGHGPMKTAFIETSGKETEIDVCGLCSGIWLDGHECHLTEPMEWQEPEERQLQPLDRPSKKLDYWQDYEVGSTRSNALVDILFDDHPLDVHMMSAPRRPQLGVLIVVGLIAFYLLTKFLVPMLTF